ncbi:MAG: ABC-F type ribosomal protection protein [Clostridiales bacterium]|jgi:lincosamide and streptogramin A transport system ATP-binding/permease protein|nr:ABC-F type ribosomal protection protein [Clostridiales bacterium]
MSTIQVSNLTFAYESGGGNIFENVSFRFDTDWRLGFIGRNGRGKTTFLKLLMGQYEYSGEITSSVGFEYFPFEVADSSQPSQAAAEGIVPGCESWRLARELSALEFDLEALPRAYATLSLGERTKLLLAALFLRQEGPASAGGFLLIDEPTNHLDLRARQVTSRYLRSKAGFILVSHDRVFLDSCVDHILSINKANIEIQRGNFTSWQENKRQRDEFELRENERLKKDIARLGKAAARTSGWSDRTEASKIGRHVGDRGFVGHKAAKMMKRAKNAERRFSLAAEEKAGLLRNLESASPLAMYPLKHHTRRLVEFKDVSIGYNGRTVCENLNFTLEQGQRLGLTGKNGSGKSSALKLIMEEAVPHSGSVSCASGLKISYVPQDTSGLSGSLRDYAEACGIDATIFMTLLRKLDFTRLQFEKDMRHYSGGQRKKVLLARSLCERSHLYIWDEPFNFVDIFSRIQIEELIVQYQPTMLFVEHDLGFVSRAATDTLEL